MSFLVNAVGSIFSSGAKKKASKQAQAAYNDAQEKAIQQAKDTQAAQQARLAPYSDAGRVGLDKLKSGIESGYYTKPFSLDDFHADPGYEFRKEEGLRALDRTLNARGSLFSGAQIRGAQDYGQNIASEEYGNAYNRYNSDINNDYTRTASLANLGLTADTGIADTLGTEGSNIRSSLIDIGGNNSGAIRERGAINADLIKGIANDFIGQSSGSTSSTASGAPGTGSNDILGSLKALLAGNSGTSGVASTMAGASGVGTSLSSLARIFAK